jgi:hypothetical protein
MGIHLGYYFFLNGLCPGLVDIHLGDESTSKGLKLLTVGSYFTLHFLQIGIGPFP